MKIFSLENSFKRYWDLFIFILATYCSIDIPFWILFPYPQTGFFFFFEIFISIAFFVDLIFNFRTSYFKNEILITDPLSIAKNYLFSWFLLDLLSVIPLELFIEYGIIPKSLMFICIFRFLRIIKLTDGVLFKRTWGMHEFDSTSFMRLGFLVYWITIFAHWTACGWIVIDGGVGGVSNPDTVTRYIRAIYWSVTTLTTIGYGDITPVSNAQTIYTMCIMLVGAGAYGYLVANIATILANSDIVRTQFVDKIQKINTFMKYKKLPSDMQKNILDYYDYIWKNRKGYDENQILRELPPSLRMKVSIYLNSDLVRKVPILKNASDDLISKIIVNLVPVVYMKGDFIFRKGDTGHNLYFISKGQVEILAEDGITSYGILNEGNFFGEIALIMDTPRTASIRAMDYCDLYYLDKDTFMSIILHYPEFAAHIDKLIKERETHNKSFSFKKTDSKTEVPLRKNRKPKSL
ncbi:MAG: cyclic nucleotide-binding domain-containing protein [Leptospiraceae bacterium]|jgi:hypothetical protein|nr:cyclic nucleotide-binding domain-containing protein [Leptospiraceae bacterium]